MNDLEQTLRSTLTRAADGAAHPPTGLGAAIEARYRRRVRRRRALAAAVAVVGIVATGALTLQRPPTPPPATTPTQEPAEKVWPRAVRELPPELAGEPLSALVLGADGGTLIVGRQHDDVKSKEGPVTRAVYAVGTTTRKLFDLPERASAAGNLAVGAGRLVWTTRPDRVWVASLRDGRPRSLGSLGLGTIDGLTVEEGRIILSVAKGGVYAMPLSGGRPRLLAKGAHLLRWPWVGATERLPYRTFVRLTDLQLGRHDTAAVRPADRDLRCGLVYCSGFTEDGAAFTRMRDGSEQRPYPGNMQQLIGDRLAITELPGSRYGVRDLVNGTEAALGGWFAGSGNRYLTYGRGDKAFVIDLSAIR